MMGGGVTLEWTSIPSGGSSNITCRFMLLKPELSAGMIDMGHLAHKIINRLSAGKEKKPIDTMYVGLPDG